MRTDNIESITEYTTQISTIACSYTSESDTDFHRIITNLYFALINFDHNGEKIGQVCLRIFSVTSSMFEILE